MAPGGARPTFPLVTTIVWGFFLLPGLLGAALSSMFFDAPGSTGNPAAYVNALIVVSFPVLCLLSIAASWILWALRKTDAGRSVTGVQLAAAALPLLPVAYVAVALVAGTLTALTSGQPMGLHSTIIQH